MGEAVERVEKKPQHPSFQCDLWNVFTALNNFYAPLCPGVISHLHAKESGLRARKKKKKLWEARRFTGNRSKGVENSCERESEETTRQRIRRIYLIYSGEES